MQRVGAAEGQRGDRERRHRIQAGGGERARRNAHTAAAPDDDADRQADAELAHEEHGMLARP